MDIDGKMTLKWNLKNRILGYVLDSSGLYILEWQALEESVSRS
jgi:hypothetical protein